MLQSFPGHIYRIQAPFSTAAVNASLLPPTMDLHELVAMEAESCSMDVREINEQLTGKQARAAEEQRREHYKKVR